MLRRSESPMTSRNAPPISSLHSSPSLMRLLRTTWSRIPLQQPLPPYRSGIYCRKWYTAPAKPSEDGWETVIGLEIHAQIKTPYKLFSSGHESL